MSVGFALLNAAGQDSIYLFSYFMDNNKKLTEELFNMGLVESKKQEKARVVCDLISGMTDRYAIVEYDPAAIFD